MRQKEGQGFWQIFHLFMALLDPISRPTGHVLDQTFEQSGVGASREASFLKKVKDPSQVFLGGLLEIILDQTDLHGRLSH